MRPELDQLLRLGVSAAQNGNRSAARALFFALSREYPDDARVWVGLAGVAADEAEQRHAIERALTIDPDQPAAREALARLDARTAAASVDASTTELLPETILARVDVDAPAPVAPDDAERAASGAAESARFPLLNLIAAGIMLALLATVGVVIGRALLGGAGPPLTPTPLLQAQLQPSVAVATAALPAATSPGLLAPTAAVAPTPALPPASPAPSATASPAQPGPATATDSLPLGTILDVDGWSATLLRPDYALVLDGAVGGFQPAGRFVLAMLAVSNNSATPRRIPSDLFVLADAQGRRYSPTPGASSSFLDAYGRGQYGDLALEDEVTPLSGMRTVPLIFDVPPDAAGLTLTVSGASSAGWPINSGAAEPVGP